MTLPPSAVTILGLLASRGPSTHKDLIDAARIPARTVRFALARLKEEGRVRERPSFRDSRQSYYVLATAEVARPGWPTRDRSSGPTDLVPPSGVFP